MVVDREKDWEAEEAVEEVTEGEVELEHGGAAPQVGKPRLARLVSSHWLRTVETVL